MALGGHMATTIRNGYSNTLRNIKKVLMFIDTGHRSHAGIGVINGNGVIRDVSLHAAAQHRYGQHLVPVNSDVIVGGTKVG